jgi:hypothetical protein
MQEVISVTVIKERHQDALVDGVRFDMGALFECLIESSGLSEDAKHRNVEIAATVDDARLDDNCQHITIGFKFCDKLAKYPVTGKYIFANEDGEKDDEHIDNLQSGAWCFPALSFLATESMGTYEKYIRPIYEYCEELGTVGVPKNRWKPFLVSEPQDMKSNWLCLKRGGPAKSPGIKHFCHLCQIRSNDISLPNQLPCLTCLYNGDDCEGA